MPKCDPNSAGSDEEYEFFKYVQRKEQQRQNQKKEELHPPTIGVFLASAIALLIVYLFFHH